MKYLSVIFLCFFWIFFGCNKHTETQRNLKSLNDSIAMRELWDTAYILKNIAKCDSLITLEKNRKELYVLYMQKSNLLGQIGRIKDAYHEMGIAARLLPESDMRRLEYEAIGAYLDNDMERYSQLLHKAIDDCRRYPQNASNTIQIASYYILLDDDKSAKKVLKDFLKYKDDEFISDYYKDYSFYKKELHDARKMLIEALTSQQDIYKPDATGLGWTCETDTVLQE